MRAGEREGGGGGVAKEGRGTEGREGGAFVFLAAHVPARTFDRKCKRTCRKEGSCKSSPERHLPVLPMQRPCPLQLEIISQEWLHSPEYASSKHV